MAQSLFSCTCSNLRLHGLRSSDLIGAALHLRYATVPARPRRRSLVLAAAETRLANEVAATNEDETKSIVTTGGDSLAQANTAPNLQISPESNKPSWDKITLGAILLFSVTLFRQALKIREMTKDVNSAVEVVQTIAERAEKAADEVAKTLPDGKLKETALKLEKIASLVDRNAALAESFLDKVDDVVEELEEKLQPVNKDVAAANAAARSATPPANSGQQ